MQLQNARTQRSESFQNAQSRAKRRAQEEAQRQMDIAREELGRILFATLEEYFPSQAQERRRENSAKVLVLGIAIGFLLRHLASRR